MMRPALVTSLLLLSWCEPRTKPECNDDTRGQAWVVPSGLEVCGDNGWKILARDFCAELRKKTPAQREAICLEVGMGENCGCAGMPQ